MPQLCVMIGCTRCAGARSILDQRFSFPKDPHRRVLWIAAITAEGFGTKNEKDSRVRGRHFLLGRPFSDKSHPDFTLCVVYASAKTSAAHQQDVLASSSFLKGNIRSSTTALASLCLNFTKKISHTSTASFSLSFFFSFFKTSKLSNSTSSPANTVFTVREQLDDTMSIVIVLG